MKSHPPVHTVAILIGMAFMINPCPLIASPSSRLTFKPAMTDAAYQKFIAECDPQRINPEVVEKSPFPAWAVWVTGISPNSQAEREGLAAGWVLKSTNGETYWHHAIERDGPDKAKREIVGISPDGLTTRTFTFGPGRIGYNSANHYRPENELVKGIPAGPWRRDMMIAAVAWDQGRQDVAETALNKAVNAGMPANDFTTYYSALVHLDRGDRAAALKEFEELKLLVDTNQKPPGYFFTGMKALGLAFNDFPYLSKLLTHQGRLRTETNRETVERWIASPLTKQESLLAVAKARGGENLMPGAVSYQAAWYSEDAKLDVFRFKDKRFAQIVPPGRHMEATFEMEKPVRDVIWNIRVALAKSGPPDPEFNSTLKFALTDRRLASSSAKQAPQDSLRNSVIQFAVTEEASGERWNTLAAGPQETKFFIQRSAPYMSPELLRLLKNSINKGTAPVVVEGPHMLDISLIRRGNEVEVDVNGHAYMRVPIDPAVQDLGFYMQNVGYTIVIDRMEVHEIAKD